MSVATPPPARFTANDLLAMPGEGAGFELVDGQLREINTSIESSFIGGKILRIMSNYSEPLKLGIWLPQDTGFQCFDEMPNQIRKPDVAFVRRARMTRREYLAGGWCRVAPDFLVEVVSPNDTSWDIQEKREEWQHAGVKLIWLVDPGDETIRVYTPGGPVRLFDSTDIINAEPIIPGFTCPVSAFFAEPPLADS